MRRVFPVDFLILAEAISAVCLPAVGMTGRFASGQTPAFVHHPPSPAAFCLCQDASQRQLDVRSGMIPLGRFSSWGDISEATHASRYE